MKYFIWFLWSENEVINFEKTNKLVLNVEL